MNPYHRLAYCMNVHPGTDCESVLQNLETHSLAVRRRLVEAGALGSDEPMGIGLWFADSTAREFQQGNRLIELRDWLVDHRLLPFTMNGFPQNNFHQRVVKHRVYQPTWWQPERLEYTLRLVDILDVLLPSGERGSISTLPIAWSSPVPTRDELAQAARQLKVLARSLDRLLQEKQREIVIAIEPEPGCAITDGRSMRSFFHDWLLDDSDREMVARHIGVCHDICHAAVMREHQGEECFAYRDAGLRIAKVQVSSALEVDWSAMDALHRRHALDHLAQFAEDRYLHQTSVVGTPTDSPLLYEDLPSLLTTIERPETLQGVWRIHFHVPIFLDQAGPLGTTQSDIVECVRTLYDISSDRKSRSGESLEPFFTGHWEVETYAWSVLPAHHRGTSLDEDLAKEFFYLQTLLK